MTRPKNLRLGVDSPAPSQREEASRIAVLQATVQQYLPRFADAIQKALDDSDAGDAIIYLHQVAFAASYDDDEYMLLGMAIKYAGLLGVSIRIAGKNHESF